MHYEVERKRYNIIYFSWVQELGRECYARYLIKEGKGGYPFKGGEGGRKFAQL